MFKLRQLRPEGGDCTAPYEVDLGGEYTVGDFIRDVLIDDREWGYIGIYNGKDIFGNPNCEYSHGELKTTLPDDFLGMKIVNATASGGWSRMDYLLTVEPVDGVFIQITDHYGIRHENIYGDSIFVVYRVGSINREKRISGFKNRSAAVHECRYLERLNSPKWM